MDNYNMVKHLELLGISNKKVLDAMLNVPREFFVGKDNIKHAYINTPLPLIKGQTISQPYTVAFMLQLIEPKEGMKVLEIGTGSGWNAVLLAYLADGGGRVITIERIKALYEIAKKNYKSFLDYVRYKKSLGERTPKLAKIDFIYGDGSEGYKQHAPYDRIMFTCAVPEIKRVHIDQLTENGILVAPVGKVGLSGLSQEMVKIKKKGEKVIKESYGEFVFVPLLDGLE